jgi:arginyl-tRNA synthetase
MSFDPVQALHERFSRAIGAAFPEHAGADPLITPSKNPKFGDFQSNAAMPLGKALGKNPREVAQAIVKHLDVTGLADPVTEASIAGPGFINVTLRADALADLLGRLDTPSLGLEPPAPGEARTVVVDLCGVNLAKQMHVGHLRAVIIGDAIARVLERLGQRVIRQNHVGDWGLPIAMVTAKLMRLEAQGRDIGALDLDALEKLYREAQRECDADERGLAAAVKYDLGPKVMAEVGVQVADARECMAEAKATLVRLQAHDPATVAVWKRIADVTMRACLATCARLGADVREEHSAGESSYAEELAPLVADLVRRGVTEESEGALVIRVEGFEEPCIIRKSDGGFLYATTDLAGIRRRVQKFGAERVVYCVDARQGLHFKLVFGAAHKAGLDRVPRHSEAGASGVPRHSEAGALSASSKTAPVNSDSRLGEAGYPEAGYPASLEHAAFGMVMGPDGRPYKTRSGENVKLWDLLDEARERAAAAVAAKSPDLSGAERGAIAEAVGIAAIKYADLSNDRVKDYIFDFDRMLGFEGNTGPYLLYALVRIRSIFRKAGSGTGGPPVKTGAIVIAAPEEKTLALTLLRFPGVVRGVAASLEPHRLCQYLFDLAGAFSGFFTNCPVLQAPDEATRASRLRLCAITERVLAEGLGLLGIPTLERM